MRLRRSHWALVVVLAVLAALAGAALLRRHAPPEPVRLLPEGDAVIYVNLKNVRHLTNFNAQPVANREAGYDRFVRETGIEWERDLDEAALAVHAGLANGQNRYSEVLTGHFDSEKLSRYLRSISRSPRSTPSRSSSARFVWRCWVSMVSARRTSMTLP
jgi:hypothetical protein